MPLFSTRSVRPLPASRFAGLGPVVVAGTLLLALPAAHAAFEVCEVGGQPVNPNNGSTTEGKTGTMRCRDRDTGAFISEQELRNGRLIGLDRRYENGKLVRERQVNDKGNTDGVLRDFAPNGQLLHEANYENGDTVGLARSYHPGGQLRRATLYAKGNGERAYAEFNADGKLRDLQCADRPVLAPTVDDGRLCGFGGRPSQLEFFRDDGIVRARAAYENGRRVRLETLYDNGVVSQQQEASATSRTERSFSREGVKRREVLYSVSGTVAQMERDQEFSAAGTLARERRWEQGELASEQQFYLNGQPRSKSAYATEGNLRSVVVTGFHDNGAVASSGRFLIPRGSYQLAVGSHRSFNANGKVESERLYDDQGRLSRERAWDDSGQLVRDDAVFEDGSRKAFAK